MATTATTTALGGGARSLPSGVLWFELLNNETIIATTVSDTLFDERILDCAALEELGPALQDIMVHLELRGRTGAFECRVSLQYKYQDGEWGPTPPTDVVLPLVSTEDYVLSSPYSDRARLGRRRIRLVLQYRTNATGNGTVGDRGQLSIAVACRPFCC